MTNVKKENESIKRKKRMRNKKKEVNEKWKRKKNEK